ncbi:MAG: hypothetical protein K2J98_01730, partial [Malacoplasma sp.]|nr:hypothetical protein [Malacoplasma sp.]
LKCFNQLKYLNYLNKINIYDYSNIKVSDLENEQKLKNLKIKSPMINENILKNNERILVLKMERYYILRQIFEFFKHLNLFVNDKS